MLRSAFVTFSLALALAAAASAQVTVNNGTATTYPVAVPPQIANTVVSEGIPAVPAINTPVAHVGPAAVAPSIPGETSQPVVAAETEITPASNMNQPLNLGVSGADAGSAAIGDDDLNGQSLADAARELKHKDQATNAKMYTNADIDNLSRSAGAGFGANAGISANAQNDNWPANNGVISPEPQGAIASPAQSQSTTGTSPFAPQVVTPESQTANPPQAMNQKPSAGTPYEMAQNDSSIAAIPQQEPSTSAAPATLPKTASRLPLLGVLGFFSISMGLFVRYQREKATK